MPRRRRAIHRYEQTRRAYLGANGNVAFFPPEPEGCSGEFRGRVTGGCRADLPFFVKVLFALLEIAPGATGEHGVVEPGHRNDWQQDDPIDDEADVRSAKNGEQREKHRSEERRNHCESPGYTAIAGELFFDRFDP